MTAAPTRRRRPELWLAPTPRPRRRPPSPVTVLPQVPPPPLEVQLAALEGELRAWGREVLL